MNGLNHWWSLSPQDPIQGLNSWTQEPSENTSEPNRSSVNIGLHDHKAVPGTHNHFSVLSKRRGGMDRNGFFGYLLLHMAASTPFNIQGILYFWTATGGRGGDDLHLNRGGLHPPLSSSEICGPRYICAKPGTLNSLWVSLVEGAPVQTAAASPQYPRAPALLL